MHAHAGILRLYQALLRLRRTEPALRQNDRDGFTVEAVSEEGVALRIGTRLERTLLVVAHFGEKPGAVDLDYLVDPAEWERVLSTEDADFCSDARPITSDVADGALRVRFERSGAIVFARRSGAVRGRPGCDECSPGGGRWPVHRYRGKTVGRPGVADRFRGRVHGGPRDEDPRMAARYPPPDADRSGSPRRPLIEPCFGPLSAFCTSRRPAGIVLLDLHGARPRPRQLAVGRARSPTFWQTRVGFAVGGFELDKPLLLWINDGLMTVFFFVVGLEIKREIVFGELRDPRKAALPVAAALGGMVVPAAVYLSVQAGGRGSAGGASRWPPTSRSSSGSWPCSAVACRSG